MRKLFTTAICTFIAISLCACSKQSSETGGKEKEKNITEELEKVGFKLTCKDTDKNFACGYKNEETSAAFVYNDEVGLAYQSENNSYLSLDNPDLKEGGESREELESEYNKILENAKISINDLRGILTEEFNDKVKGSDYYRGNHKGFEAGTYEVGKDLDSGEYLVLMNVGANNTSVEVRKNEYTNGDDFLYGDSNFYNDYIIVYNGMFVETDGVTLYKISDSPKVASNYNIVNLKVGRDIKAGNYTITPTDETMSYYEISTKNKNDYGTLGEIISNDVNFSSPKKVNLVNGQYLKLSYATINK